MADPADFTVPSIFSLLSASLLVGDSWAGPDLIELGEKLGLNVVIWNSWTGSTDELPFGEP